MKTQLAGFVVASHLESCGTARTTARPGAEKVAVVILTSMWKDYRDWQ